MRRRLATIRFAVAVTIIAAIPVLASSQAPPPLVQLSHLQGQIVDSAGRPLRSAMIETDDPARAAISDKNGFFRLKNLPAGPITISVRHAGYVATGFQLRLPPDSTVGIGVKLMPDAAALSGTTAKVDTAVSYHGASMMLRVISSDSQPLAHASVTVEGGLPQITDAKGEMSLGGGGDQLFTFSVRRLGYAPWFGKVEFPDSASVYTVTLAPIVHDLSTVVVKGARAIMTPLEVAGFYDRWQMRQRGALSAVFIGPEELEFRHPAKITDMLAGLNGVKIVRDKLGNMIPYSTQIASLHGDMCAMAILIDGHQMRDVILDQYLVPNEVMGIEVYSRTGNTPITLHANNNVCGIIAVWTGSQKP
jgi:hypothetical protein